MTEQLNAAPIPALKDLSPPIALTEDHDVSRFECTRDTITNFLRDRGKSNQAGRHSAVFVQVDSNSVVWTYYALSVNAVTRKIAFARRDRNGTPEEIPVLTLGRLGVHASLEGKGLGRELIVDAMMRVGRMARGQDPAHRLPVAAMMIQAAEEELVPFYEKLQFSAKSKEHPLMLTRPIADIEALLAAAEAAKAVGHIADMEGARLVIEQ